MNLDELFEKIGSQRNQQLPYVAYRKPNTEELIILFQKNASLYTASDFTESGFVFAPFESKNNAILIPLEHSEKLTFIVENIEILQKKEVSFLENEKNKDFHTKLVKKGMDAIKNGDLKKVVVSRKESIGLSETNPLEIFKRLLSSYSTAFVYCFYHPKVGIWLGATPETLLKIEGHKFFTTALAGTQKYDDNVNIEWKPKEKEEQNMVTNFIVDNLKPLVKHLIIEATQSVKAGNLLHLKTNISGTLDFKAFNLRQILNTLHPTPAVCGLPKDNAKQFILKYENYNREFYTGFLGELNYKVKISRNTNRHNVENDAYSTITTESNLFVNLRCMQLKDQEALIYAGGGITKDSNPDEEWEETVNKTQTIKSVL